MSSFTTNANFSQREFQIPFLDKEMASPTYSYTESQTSSNEATHNQLMNQNTRNESIGSQGSRRAFSLSSMLPTRGKKPAEPKASGDKVEKVQKRRGPKPDSKPAQNRRQELNRAAQRTHRERKELYLKDLELRLNQSQASAAQVSLQKNKIAQEKKALEAHVKACESENRHLKQLLEANHIPLLRTNMAKPQQPSAPRKMSTNSNPSITRSYSAQSDPPETYGSIGNGYQNAGINYSPADATAISNYASPMQGSLSSGHTPIYSPNDPSVFGFAAASTNGYATSPQGFSPLEDSNIHPATSSAQEIFPPAFKDPSDPKFVNFIVDLEETCKDHAGFMMERLHNENSEDISGHALMLSAPTLTQQQEHSGPYQTQPPPMAMADLNLLLLNSRPFNRNGEVTPIMAAHMIMADERFHLLSQEDFVKLQKSLKLKSRCYGFGAVLEDYEIIDAMNEACAQYTNPTEYKSEPQY